MNKDCKIWTAALCICCFCACTGEDSIPTTPDGGKGVPIGFTVDESTTRAQLTTAENMNSMALFAYHTTGNFNAVTATPNYMFNTPVNKVNGVWTYSPILYWPIADADRISFFAITPIPTADNGITVETTAETPGYPTFRITPPASPTQQADFCIAPPILNATYDAPTGTGTPAAEADKGKVPLSFGHAMSKIRFKAHYTTSSTTPVAGNAINIQSVAIEFIEITGVAGSGKVQLAQDGKYIWTENTGTGGKYTLEQSKGELATTLLKEEEVTTEGADIISTDAGTLCLVPQTIPDGAQLKVLIKGKASDGKTIGYLLRTSLTGTWEAGKAYAYNIVINDMDAEVTTEEVWEFSYNSNAAQTFTVPANGIYKIEIWGNQGGIFSPVEAQGGKGGYTAGEIELTKGDELNIYVGQCNYSNNHVEGWNGGGRAGGYYSSPGGGSIDIRFKQIVGNYGFSIIDDISNASNINPFTGLTGNESTDPRIIVGGGGGGIGSGDGGYANISLGGYAGGETGGDSKADRSTSSGSKSPHDGGKGGTQMAGGAEDRGTGHYVSGLTPGSAGRGGNAGSSSVGGGGGGGWFGGGGGSWVQYTSGGGGGGGSSHVHSKLFTNPVLKAGNETFKSPTGEDETGHTGAGLVRITLWPEPIPAP